MVKTVSLLLVGIQLRFECVSYLMQLFLEVHRTNYLDFFLEVPISSPHPSFFQLRCKVESSVSSILQEYHLLSKILSISLCAGFLGPKWRA